MVYMKKINTPVGKKKKKVGKYDRPFEVRIEYQEHPVWEKHLREAPEGYLGR